MASMKYMASFLPPPPPRLFLSLLSTMAGGLLIRFTNYDLLQNSPNTNPQLCPNDNVVIFIIIYTFMSLIWNVNPLKPSDAHMRQ